MTTPMDRAQAEADSEVGRVIAAAHSGEGQALAKVRGWLGSSSGVHLERRAFEVDEEGIIWDGDAPRRRREVFPAISPFVAKETIHRGSAAVTAKAIEQVRACPPLAQAFQAAALAHVGQLQTRLIVDETLGRADRAKIRREVELLVRPGRAIWESWVQTTPAQSHGRFDRLVRSWLDAPVDLGEAKWFLPGDHPYGLIAAADFFAKMPVLGRAFFGVIMDRCDFRDREWPCAVLEGGVDRANRLAAIVGLQLSFQHR